jgi:hypothetical protein
VHDEAKHGMTGQRKTRQLKEQVMSAAIIRESGEPTGRPNFQASVETRQIYDMLSAAAVGEIVSYSALSAAIGADVRKTATPAMHSARRMLIRDARMVFDAVRGVGLQRLTDSEITNSGSRYLRRVRSTSRRERRRMEVVNYSGLNDSDRLRYNAHMATLNVHELFSGRKAQGRIAEVCAAGVPSIGSTLRLFQG